MNIIDLNDFTNRKKYAKIVKELEIVLKILDLTKKGLEPFRYYGPVLSFIEMLEKQIVNLELSRKFYVNKLEKAQEEHTK